MKYQQPFGASDGAPYVNGNATTGTLGSIPTAEAIEHPQREIVAAITGAGLTPAAGDLTQLWQAMQMGAAKRTLVDVSTTPVTTLPDPATLPDGWNVAYYFAGMPTGFQTAYVQTTNSKNFRHRGQESHPFYLIGNFECLRFVARAGAYDVDVLGQPNQINGIASYTGATDQVSLPSGWNKPVFDTFGNDGTVFNTDQFQWVDDCGFTVPVSGMYEINFVSMPGATSSGPAFIIAALTATPTPASNSDTYAAMPRQFPQMGRDGTLVHAHGFWPAGGKIYAMVNADNGGNCVLWQKTTGFGISLVSR